MKITNQDHLQHPWRVHTLLPDFEIEDVWRFPVEMEDHHTLEEFRAQLKAVMDNVSQKGIAGWLFKLRFFIGEIFGWDNDEKLVHLNPGSIRERYAKEEKLSVDQLPAPGKEEFIPVYELEKEALMEIENATVHAAMHLGKVAYKQGYTVQMTVYVKPKGFLGRTYMALIKPFRLAIVYPVMMRMMGKQWKKYREQTQILVL